MTDERIATTKDAGPMRRSSTRPWWQRGAVVAPAIVAGGLIVGGFLLGDGLRRAKAADRAVTVRGLAERDVTADLAIWTIAHSAQAPTLAAAQGFPDGALQTTGATVSQFTSEGQPTTTIRQRMTLRTGDIGRAQRAVARQFDLVRRGVVLEEGSGIAYTFTKLNAIKPPMVAEATRDARKAAEQFAKDSGTRVGTIRSATQGYFSVEARDGDAGGYGAADTPYKKVRVVTTVDFYLD